ncbi:hypothetical protein SAMN05421848_1129 [Kushneria avicenniae]|uniref:Uncharacterized protein n=1 Tax=Kushneria avicenniae TaxID=402385 RepID=A0A1I1ID65_9GAMM|nr:DUF6629 family protein [Kushneria avicenniae]SFC33622.1 hypothetical protein SAMN05421848_1129 [Kushneria avicenniae]
MCFSASASFVGSAGIALVGVATLMQVRTPRTLLFAAIPILFALHQLLEGIVWLGMDGRLTPPWPQLAGQLYVFYAQGLLPVVMPMAIWLLLPSGERRRIVPFLLLGASLSAYNLWFLATLPTDIGQCGHSITYHNPRTREMLVAIVYVIATCGALLASRRRWLVIMGLANLAGLTVVALFRTWAFTSVWCFYAALISIMVYWHFRRERMARHVEEAPQDHHFPAGNGP